MKNSIKRLFSFLLLIIISIGIGGCKLMKANTNKKRYTAEEKKEIVENYLKEKYNEEFIINSLIGGDWSQSYDRVYAYPKGGDKEEELFLVRFSLRDDGTYHLSDGYFGVIIRDEYEKAIGEFVKEIYTDFKVYTDTRCGIVFSENLNKDTKLSEIYEKDNNYYSFTTVLVKESEVREKSIEESLKKIAENMQEAKLFGELQIAIIHDDRFNEVDWGNDTLNIDEDVIKYGIKYVRVSSISGISEVKDSGLWGAQ